MFIILLQMVLRPLEIFYCWLSHNGCTRKREQDFMATEKTTAPNSATIQGNMPQAMSGQPLYRLFSLVTNLCVYLTLLNISNKNSAWAMQILCLISAKWARGLYSLYYDSGSFKSILISSHAIIAQQIILLKSRLFWTCERDLLLTLIR